MDTNLKTKLEELGADVNNTILRFMGNEDLYLKFLNKFQNDQSYANIEKYLAEENATEAFKAAHTLKGVAANLGSTPSQSVPLILQNFCGAKRIFRELTKISLMSQKNGYKITMLL